MDTQESAVDSPSQQPPRRRRWLLPTLLLIALLSGMTVWMVHINARRSFVGKTDPATGYRCVFTLAPGWQPGPRLQLAAPNNLVQERARDTFNFQPPKPAPLQVWLEKHLLHRLSPKAAANPLPQMNEINIVSSVGTSANEMRITLQDGYPDPKIDRGVLPIAITTMEQKRMLVSGQRATWSAYKIDLSALLGPAWTGNTPKVVYAYSFLIKVTDRPLWYIVSATADEEHRTLIANEIRQVRDSFRIEQAGGK
ncbi:MAG TPA: hypothetical protein VKU00_23485 [Chthonomonadaceae bacterium]|nr:hypothetical protein [Chthonomonadaceae bacterium]